METTGSSSSLLHVYIASPAQNQVFLFIVTSRIVEYNSCLYYDGNATFLYSDLYYVLT
ncbi:hypothetical protein HMPREF0083_05619 [Aneurinibacillus aneurinilyticus ATCC 12856]|uniref:Uncharacterized protein n=1 Tax=Aneurinibacillus aneurinilyticus ATCC 12856 TaxID=649747 RepID=U1WAS6_ANEAE|nr:hypothetical protein HMPREF0083_05619 [Aneurinibacillus aneurinilyticus ATCC 12856]